MDTNKKSAAIVLAAGSGKRMGGSEPKQFLELGGHPILYYTLKAFEESSVEEVVLVTSGDWVSYCRDEIVKKGGFSKVIRIVTGGAQRYHSVAKGLEAVTDAGLVMIHDGARPFVTPELIDDLLQKTREYPACVTATPLSDTVKLVDEEGFCMDTPPRDRLWAVQTPQSFSYPLIRKAYQKLLEEEESLLAQKVLITDDAQVCELFGGCRVRLVKGSYFNRKLTTPEDLLLAQRLLEITQNREK
ncbi:MAG: 2-C-methyl-D-erythritol 4-phosphate cytidylyltransferase [Lachnospiraceae bacterium]|nr:2-C-methyl-D-erythritol 4-phosphate cytidylyltransferase [Lachnospiraceae bacterium]